MIGLAPPAPPLLHVAGNRLRYGPREVRLRGVCVGDAVLARKDRPLDDYAAIAGDWRSNAVRIGVAPTTWRNGDKAETMRELRAQVAAALAQKMFVIVDWHVIGWPGEGPLGAYSEASSWPGDPKDLYDADFGLALDFWRACAREFGADGRVAFQLWCEPVRGKDAWNGNPGESWPRLKPWFSRLIAAIRAEGAPNLVLASGDRWAYDLRGIRQSPLEDRNAAYEWHVYAGHGNNDPQAWAAALDGLDRERPVLVTEWGFEEETKGHFKGTEEAFGKPFLDFIEARRMSWTAWCWHPSWGPPMLTEDWRTPTVYGAFVRDALRRLNRRADRP